MRRQCAVLTLTPGSFDVKCATLSPIFLAIQGWSAGIFLHRFGGWRVCVWTYCVLSFTLSPIQEVLSTQTSSPFLVPAFIQHCPSLNTSELLCHFFS